MCGFAAELALAETRLRRKSELDARRQRLPLGRTALPKHETDNADTGHGSIWNGPTWVDSGQNVPVSS